MDRDGAALSRPRNTVEHLGPEVKGRRTKRPTGSDGVRRLDSLVGAKRRKEISFLLPAEQGGYGHRDRSQCKDIARSLGR